MRILLLVLSFAFVGVFGTILPAEFPQVRVATQVVYGGVLAAWAVLRLGRTRSHLDLPILAALLALLLASFLGRDVLGGLEMVAGGLSFALLYWFMFDTRAPARRQSIALGVVGAITAWLIVFAARWTMEKVSWVANGGGMPNLLDSTQTLFWLTTNAIPVLTLLGIGFVGHLPKSPASRLLIAVFILASVFTVPMSGGRAAWVGLVVAAGMWWALGDPRARSLLTTRRVVVAAAVITLIPFGVGLSGVTGPYVTGLSARLPLWNEALAIFAASPLTGGGPGTFAWLRMEHIPDYHVPVPASLAHDVPIQTAADGGLLLLASLLSIAVIALVVIWRGREWIAGRDRRSVAVLIGFAVASLLDDHSSLPAITAMAVTLLAWTMASTPGDVRPPPRWRRPVLLAALAGAALVAVPAVARVDLARLDAEAGRTAAAAGDWSASADAFASATGWYPSDAQHQLSLGLSLARTGREAEARDAYGRASELAPGDARAWGGLAALTDDSTEREQLLARASRLPTADPQYAYRLGTLLTAQGRMDRAQAAYEQAVARLPALILTIDPGRPDDRRALSESTLAAVDALGQAARLPLDEIEWDLALAGMAPASNVAPAWQVILELQGGDSGSAEQALVKAEAEARWSATTWQAARAVAEYSCDADRLRNVDALLDLLPGGRATTVSTGVKVAPDLLYRETGLGDYQPMDPAIPADLFAWPDPYLAPPAC